jgi:hypothetical protein
MSNLTKRDKRRIEYVQQKHYSPPDPHINNVDANLEKLKANDLKAKLASLNKNEFSG